jgi:hypothetical protein
MELKVIVIRQPWAWLIVNGFKDVENRTWRTRYRGALIIQASAAPPGSGELQEFRKFALKRGAILPEQFETGGIVGIVQLADCVTRSRSKWFHGPVGWVLSDPRKLSFIELKGRLGLFDPPGNVRRRVLAQLRREK